MQLELRERTAETVVTYFRMTRDVLIRKYFPQKAQSEEEALADFALSKLPGATSFGRTIWVDARYVGDIWCYCIQKEEPNAMVSYCIFDKQLWSKGCATKAVERFLLEIKARFQIRSVGAFTYSENTASIQVLRKNGFHLMETYTEDGEESCYFQKEF